MALRLRRILALASLLGGFVISSAAPAANIAEGEAEAGVAEGVSTVLPTSSPSVIYTTTSSASVAAVFANLYDDLTRPPVEARQNKVAVQGDRAPVTLMLDATINGAPLPDIVVGELTSAGDFILPESFWMDARLKTPAKAMKLSNGSRGYVLGSVPGLTYSLNLTQMSLTITAPVTSFIADAIDIGRDVSASPEKAPPGGYLNYDLSITRSSDGSVTYGGLLDAVLFNGWGSLVNRAVFRGTSSEENFMVLRTETFWQKDLPGEMMSLVMGDTISSEGGWSQPVRYGGVRIGRNFGLAPSFITFPLPSINGSAALPSTIDVLVNNTRQKSDITVSPGAFNIRNLPVVNGAGQINLIVTDLRGVQSVLTRDYYSSAKLLAPGLSDFSFEAGALRRKFGIRSNNYGAGFVAASWRQGVTNGLTLQGRFELQKERQAVGGEGVLQLGKVGLVRAAASYSTGRLSPSDWPATKGWRYLVGFERISRHGSITAEWEHFDKGFERFGDYDNIAKPRDRLRVGAGISPIAGVSIGTTYIDQKNWDGDRFRILSGNAGVSLPQGFTLSVYAADRLSKREGRTFGINLIKTLGLQRSAAASLNHTKNRNYSKSLALTQSTPIGPGIGWQIEATDNSGQELRAGVTFNTNSAQLNAEAALRQNSNMVRIAANGSVGWLKGMAFASRQINDHSFAVVEVGDLPGVRVYRANQYAATTNSKGKALVTGLLPYEENRISLEADELPFNAEISDTDETARPYARSGLFIKFPVKRSLNALIKIRTPAGEYVPVGASVRVDNGMEFMVGHRGEAYLTSLAASNTLDISWPGGQCLVRLSIESKSAEEARVIPLTCGGKE